MLAIQINAFSIFPTKSSKTTTFLINIFMPVISLGKFADAPHPDWQRVKIEIIVAARGKVG